MAIFALPHLGQASLDMESKRWERAIQSAAGQAAFAQIEAIRYASEYELKREELVENNGSIRAVALAVSFIAAVYLIYISMFSDSSADVWTGCLIVTGFVPGLALVARNKDAVALLQEYAIKRKQFE